MVRDGGEGLPVLDVLGDRFLLLIRGLIQGNRKRAQTLALDEQMRAAGSNTGVMSQNLIEHMAQVQAVKNSLINLPSVVPGLGTLVSFSLVGVENFYLLDQSITLILALCLIHGKDIEDQQAVEEFVVGIIGEVFGVTSGDEQVNPRSVTREYVSRLLPMKYLNRGMDRGIRKILHRLVPLRRHSRLLPAGIGIGSSAVSAYDMVVNVGQTTLKRLPRFGNSPPDAP